MSAAFMAALGLIALFVPDQVLRLQGAPADDLGVLLVQMMAALYIGFASLNWAARGVLIGGIYARPVAMGNFTHFGIVAIVLTKAAFELGTLLIAPAAAVFVLFAVWFGLVLFRPPKS
ncbi:MAG: hypothetical protein QNJ07_02485 [Woeseiaceae bacterium]|nr:hypothetical protein [Woeseiaceae bacterium]